MKAGKKNYFKEARKAFQQAARDRFFEKPAQRGIEAANALMQLKEGTRN